MTYNKNIEMFCNIKYNKNGYKWTKEKCLYRFCKLTC